MSINQLTLKDGLSRVGLLGVLMMILGVTALCTPFVTTLAMSLAIGGCFIAGGVLQSIYAVQSRYTGQFILKLVTGIIYICGGVLLVMRPYQGVVSLTLALGCILWVNSFLHIAIALQLRPKTGWKVALFNGLSGFLLGGLIIAQWPTNAPWLLGLLVGINLFINGATMIRFAIAGAQAIESDPERNPENNLQEPQQA